IHSHYRELFDYRGQKIEAMVHRISECKKSLLQDKRRRNKSFLDLITKGVIIKDTDQCVQLLQESALKIYQKMPAPFSSFEADLYHYIICNRLNDFEDNSDYHESYFIFSNLLYFLTKVVLI